MVAAGVLLALLVPAPSTAAPSTETEAPAAAPAGTPVVRSAKGKTGTSKTGKANAGASKAGPAKAASAPPAPWMSVDPDRAARPDGAPPPTGHRSVVSHATPNDPVEIGGKWNGSNASSAQTRSENYNGDAAGTGGSVGLKLHF